jgi:membrane-associated phospholipid phosphatase
MDAFQDFQVQIILFLQGLGEWLNGPALFFSFLGYEQFYLLIAPALYWCLDAKAGLRFGIFFMLSGSINTIFKFLLHAPRPYWVSERVNAFAIETSFGLPSGHAQNAVMVFGSLMRPLRHNWYWAAVGILALLIGLSRLVLGVHFLGDVLAGWLIGATLLWTCLRWEAPVLSWLKQKTVTQQILLLFVASLVLPGLGIIIRYLYSGWLIPLEWVENAGRWLEPGEVFDPYDLSGLVAFSGVFFGFTTGAVILHKRGGLLERPGALQQVGRYAVGVTGLLILYIGLDLIFPEGTNTLAFAFRYFRYGVVGIWVTGLAPFIFRRIGLAN